MYIYIYIYIRYSPHSVMAKMLDYGLEVQTPVALLRSLLTNPLYLYRNR